MTQERQDQFYEEEEQLIGSLCDDIAMQYDGKPNIEDIQYTIAVYENLYYTSVSSEIVSEICRRFDVSEDVDIEE